MPHPTPTRIPPHERTATAPQPPSTPDQRLQDLHDQFARLKAQVRQAQQLSSLGTAAAMIAHEVNNLLTPILNYARAAAQSDDPTLHKKALAITVKNVEMLIAMSDRVLEISAAAPPKREDAQLRSLIEDAVKSLCRDLAKDAINFSLDVDPQCTVHADRLQLQQVFFNLLLNARETLAKSRGGRLTVSAQPKGSHTEVTLRNSGDVIPPDLLPRVFEPFQSSKTSNENKRSRCNGLGLALCRDLVEENGGTINVTSDAEHGTTFTITLPTQ